MAPIQVHVMISFPQISDSDYDSAVCKHWPHSHLHHSYTYLPDDCPSDWSSLSSVFHRRTEALPSTVLMWRWMSSLGTTPARAQRRFPSQGCRMDSSTRTSQVGAPNMLEYNLEKWGPVFSGCVCLLACVTMLFSMSHLCGEQDHDHEKIESLDFSCPCPNWKGLWTVQRIEFAHW